MQVLRLKARIIADLQSLLSPEAMQAIQVRECAKTTVKCNITRMIDS